MHISRRRFLSTTAAASSLAMLPARRLLAASAARTKMKLGLVTYLWGQDWDLPTLIGNCEKSGVLGLELRTQHKHGVEPSLTKSQREDVKKRFADSPVELVGYGSNAQYHEADPTKVLTNIQLTMDYIKLMHDCGGTGVKVKPNGFAKGVPEEKTLEQIGKALNIVAAFGADYGQKIRVEVHGRGTSKLPNIKTIMDVADHPNVGVCWNSNNQDLEGDGLEANFEMVQDRLADTVHVREMNIGSYPYDKLMKLFVDMDYSGWILLECRTKPADRVAALQEQQSVFQQLIAKAQQ